MSLLSLRIDEKSLGLKQLYRDFALRIEEGEKVGFVGRNGAGKSTLLRLITGDDTELNGEIVRARDVRVVMTAQEHHDVAAKPALEYVMDAAPDYRRLDAVLTAAETDFPTDEAGLAEYNSSLEVFLERNYYGLEETVLEELKRLGLDDGLARGPVGILSGGQKRMVELARVRTARPNLALLDEPTNHLDADGKALLIRWLNGQRMGMLIVTHDRDVLEEVDRIIEIRDLKALSFTGNYSAYLKQNADATVTAVGQYESGLRKLEDLKKQINQARARKGQVGNDAARIMEDRLQRQYDEQATKTEKPSFWIDRESAAELGKKTAAGYDKYKAATIKPRASMPDAHAFELLRLEEFTAGYPDPIFQPVSFSLSHGERLHLTGRNGAGKSTLVKTVLDLVAGKVPAATPWGVSKPAGNLRIGTYEQEVGEDSLRLTLGQAVELAFRDVGREISSERINALLAQYLFDPVEDRASSVRVLSGGQKARLQLMRLLADEPNLLVLDEPTNHLDLPSIEELEGMLAGYGGAILYISHDSHFAARLGGGHIAVRPIG